MFNLARALTTQTLLHIPAFVCLLFHNDKSVLTEKLYLTAWYSWDGVYSPLPLLAFNHLLSAHGKKTAALSIILWKMGEDTANMSMFFSDHFTQCL